MSKQYNPACYYWNCLTHVKRTNRFCSKECSQDFIHIPPPWIDKETWDTYDGELHYKIEASNKKVTCKWCGEYLSRYAKKKHQQCTTCKNRLRDIRAVIRKQKKKALPIQHYQTCQVCKKPCTLYHKGIRRPQICNLCILFKRMEKHSKIPCTSCGIPCRDKNNGKPRPPFCAACIYSALRTRKCVKCSQDIEIEDKSYQNIEKVFCSECVQAWYTSYVISNHNVMTEEQTTPEVVEETEVSEEAEAEEASTEEETE